MSVVTKLLLRTKSFISLPFQSNNNSVPTLDVDYKNLEGKGIRLVQLLPGSRSRSITCDLVYESLVNNALDFEAISYAWGSFEGAHTITCAGKKVSVTKNLYTALLNFRDQHNPRLLWIDQLCINQKDTKEKETQIGIMADIYRRASRVLIWLGEKSSDSDVAMTLAQKLADVFKHEGADAVYYSTSSAEYDVPRRSHKSWLALGNLLKRPWFQRAWVIQEVSVAKAAKIQCGLLHISFEDFAIAVNHCMPSPTRNFGSHLLYGFASAANRIMTISSYRTENQGASAAQLLPPTILLIAKSCAATDPRDKLFAFIAIAQLHIQPDYRRRVEELYVENAIRTLAGFLDAYSTDHRFAMILTRALLNAGRLSQKLCLPSWIPDLSCQYTRRPLGWSGPIEVENVCYKAGGSELIEFDILSGKELRLSVVLNSTVSITGTFNISDIMTQSDSQLQSLFRTWYAQNKRTFFGPALGSTALYVTGETWSDAWARTLVGDTDYYATSRVTIDEARKQLSEFLNYLKIDVMSVGFKLSNATIGADVFGIEVKSKIIGRVPFVTSQNLIGLAPFGVGPGDIVAVMLGSEMPVVLRRESGFSPEGDRYVLLGECYVHGLMDGEALNSGLAEITSIILV